MKTFPEGPRELNEILKIFRSKGYTIDRKRYDAPYFSDYMTFKQKEGCEDILFNTFNYRFTVYDRYTQKIIATEESEELESEAWYMDILRSIFKGEPKET